MNKKYLLGLLAIIPMILLINSAEARSSEDYQPKTANVGDTFKLFDDGITYYYVTESDIPILGIIHDGEKINCHTKRDWSYKGYISPLCVEIILRSLP